MMNAPSQLKGQRPKRTAVLRCEGMPDLATNDRFTDTGFGKGNRWHTQDSGKRHLYIT